MQRPPSTAIHRGAFFSAYGYFADKPLKRLVHLAKIRDFCGPVVHLKVYVGGVLPVPRRHRASVPDALQVGSLSSGLGTADEQVSPELEVEFNQLRVVRLGELLYSFVRRQESLMIDAKTQLDAIKPFGVGSYVAVAELLVFGVGRLAGKSINCVEPLQGFCVSIAAYVSEVDEVSSGSYQHVYFVGVADANALLPVFALFLKVDSSFPCRNNLGDAREADFSFDAFVIIAFPSDDEPSVFNRDVCSAHRGIKRGCEGDVLLLV